MGEIKLKWLCKVLINCCNFVNYSQICKDRDAKPPIWEDVPPLKGRVNVTFTEIDWDISCNVCLVDIYYLYLTLCSSNSMHADAGYFTIIDNMPAVCHHLAV